MLYTVGEIAKLLGVPASTLRYYDKEGLLPFVERSSGGIRMFTDMDYRTLKIIECLKKSGMPIREIREFIDMSQKGDDTLPERLALFRSRMEAVKKQMEETQETLDLLAYKCWYYEQAIQDGTEEKIRAMPLNELPERFKNIQGMLEAFHS